MDWDYETEAQRVRKRLKQDLSGRERLRNWWDYHKLHVLLGAALAVLAAILLLQDPGGPAADYTVCWVSPRPLEEEASAELSKRLASYGRDLNGDGTVRVEVRQLLLDLDAVLTRGTQGQREYGELLALDADLEAGQSGIFLTDDAASLQAYTGALLYLDGTVPEPGAPDWENMVISWTREDAGAIYAGLRGCWKESWEETWGSYRDLWAAMLADGGQKNWDLEDKR